ncbi:MAG: RDD family protein [Actinomycetes bacterium]
MNFCPNCGAASQGAFCGSCGTPTPSASATAPQAPPTFQVSASATFNAPVSPPPPSPYASWGRRVGGSLLDSLIFGLPTLALIVGGIIVGLSSLDWYCNSSSTSDGSSTTTSTCHIVSGTHWNNLGTLLIVLGVLISIGYLIYVIFAIGGSRGATVGMRIVKIRCVRSADYSRVGYGLSLGRSAISWVFAAISLLHLVDNLWPLWDEKNQTLHDKVVNTVVLYEA